jgi:hypothetical protein
MAKTPASKKAKGTAFEKSIVSRIDATLKDYGIWAKRTPMSGAIADWKGDITTNLGICFECKCQEHLNFREAFRQAEGAATQSQIPVMVTSRNYDRQSLALMDFEDLLMLIEYAIKGGWHEDN